MDEKKGIFIGTQEAIFKAYSSDIRDELDNLPGIMPGYYDADTIISNPGLFKNTEYIFSTWGMAQLSREQISKCLPSLKAVFYAAGSVQYFARPYLECGVRIFSAWSANAVPVAEVTVSQIILANKGFFQTLHRDGAIWTEHDTGCPYPGNYDTPVGIIGAGMVGRLVLKMLKAYRLRALVFDPFLSEEAALALGAQKVTSLQELFAKCQVISNHLADNPQTAAMLDHTCFDVMKDNAVFINTGRGRQVVEADLINALKDVSTRAAVLDVTYPEPPVEGSELYTLPNVFLTPHMAGSLGNEIARMGECMYNAFSDFTAGRSNPCEVTEDMLKTMA
ncbi:MAG: hydroxyacid dehydrogenase [Lachnospiraceae bacterium]|nr:hydroxyacid dehydrogenase [Lachnospiraceae bacterium]